MSNKRPLITVLIYTYNRPAMIRRTLQGFIKHVQYSGKFIWRLADDGSPAGYLESLAADFPELDLAWTITDRKGYGANANKGLRALTTKYVFASEDDWQADRDIDLDTGVILMEGVPTIGALRYDAASANIFLSGHVLKGSRPPISYLIIDRQRSKYWNFCGRPTLVRPSFYEAYGYLPEGVCVGRTEQDWTRRTKHMDGPDIAILPRYYGPRCITSLGAGHRLSHTEKDAGYMIEKGLIPK